MEGVLAGSNSSQLQMASKSVAPLALVVKGASVTCPRATLSENGTKWAEALVMQLS